MSSVADELSRPQVLSRRTFLRRSGATLAAGAAAAALPARLPAADAGIAALPRTSTNHHLLKRTSFGVNRLAMRELQAIGVRAYIDRQLSDEIDASRIDREVAQRFPLAAAGPLLLLPGIPFNSRYIIHDLVGATLFRHYFSPRQLYEVMVEFWSNHFSIYLPPGKMPAFKPQDDATVIRPHAYGTFAELLRATARSPAMLLYLGNWENTREAPNENYARELLELHTLGVEAGYTETDVKEVARCFTGWTLHPLTAEFLYRPEWHDDGDKTVLGQYIPAGGGQADGETVLAMLAAAPATARHLATKLCRRFIADDPPVAAVERTAATFLASGGDIRATLRALLNSAEFWAARNAKTTRPVEFVGQLVRSLNSDLRLPSGLDWGVYADILRSLGGLPFHWAPPDGYPDHGDYWATTTGLRNRWRSAQGIAYYPSVFNVGNAVTGSPTVSRMLKTAMRRVLHRNMERADVQVLTALLCERLGVTADAVLDEAQVQSAAAPLVGLLISSPYFLVR